MKRKGLVIGATTVALAAVPVIGVTAESSTTEVTDTVTVTVESSCTFATTGESEPDSTERAVTLGQGTFAKDIVGAELEVNCTNSADGAWTVAVQGENDAKLQDGSSNTIASSSGTLNGATSNWAFKLGVTGGSAIIESGYNDYSQVPTTSTKVVSSTSADKTKIQASYGVSVADDQATGTYTGKVTYTLTGGAPQE